MARRLCGWELVVGALTGLLAAHVLQSHAAEPSDSTVIIREHLAAGEFAPARRIAETLGERTERDEQLASVATAQATAGSRDSALATIGLMSDDRARAAALQSVGKAESDWRGALGGVQADFDGLMELITSTVEPSSWVDVGGNGTISPFANGVYVDAKGVLRRVEHKNSARLTALVKAEQVSAATDEFSAADVRRPSQLRKVSLPRLERAVQLRLAAGKPLTDEMQLFAGLEKVCYVLLYPATGDLVLAGPAGDWKPNNEGRIVSKASGRPLVRLEDFVVILRHLNNSSNETFGCSITPTTDGLARTKAFAEASSKTPLKPGGRDAWLAKLRDQLGRQKIDIFGIDPRTRVATVLVEADYRMKLVGMGLEDGTLGVSSYLDTVPVSPDETPPPMDVLRWWFTMNYKALISTPERDGFELRGQGVQVECENEGIDREGERIHMGTSSALNQAFAQSFTQYFATLAKKYPVYADLQNLFDLALVAALVENEGLADRVGWHALCFGDANAFPVKLGPVPKEVDTVMNHRVVRDKIVIVGVSGGVRVDPWPIVAKASIAVDTYGKLKAEHATGAAKGDLKPDRWWWD